MGPNHFGRVCTNCFGLRFGRFEFRNHFGQVQIIKVSPKKSNLNLTKMIWIRPKQFVPVQKNWKGKA